MAESSRKAKKEHNRRRLLAAAIEVFSEKGYDNSTVVQISRRAGFTHGVVYSHFQSKAELLLAALEAETDGQLDALAGANSERPVTTLLDLAIGLNSPVSEARGVLMLEALVATRRDPEFARSFEERMRRHGGRLASLVARGQHDGSIDPDVDAAALVWFGRVLGMGSLILGAVDPDPGADEKAWIDLMVRFAEALADETVRGSIRPLLRRAAAPTT
jgi:AcrR family transcriptional regulator